MEFWVLGIDSQGLSLHGIKDISISIMDILCIGKHYGPVINLSLSDGGDLQGCFILTSR